MKILFVCKHNRFRSKVAEAIFHKLDKENSEQSDDSLTLSSQKSEISDDYQENEVFLKHKKYARDEVKSAGVLIDFLHPYVEEAVKKIMKEKGYKIEDETARELNDLDLRWADKIIVVANNVSLDFFPKNKTEVWKIPDCDVSEVNKIKKIIEDIEERVKKLIVSLKNK